jgi:hypothetical protein
VFLAVFAAVTTMYMGKYSNRSVLIQGQEADQWAFYQAKSIKGHTYEMQRQKLELDFLSQEAKMPVAVIERHKESMTDWETSSKRYDREKAEIKAVAEKLAVQKALFQSMSANFSYSLIFLQIAIVMSSIAAITRNKPLWDLSLTTTIGWMFYFSDAFMLFYQPPCLF